MLMKDTNILGHGRNSSGAPEPDHVLPNICHYSLKLGLAPSLYERVYWIRYLTSWVRLGVSRFDAAPLRSKEDEIATVLFTLSDLTASAWICRARSRL